MKHAEKAIEDLTRLFNFFRSLYELGKLFEEAAASKPERRYYWIPYGGGEPVDITPKP